MKPLWFIISSLLIVSLIAVMTACENPFKVEKKKEEIKRLVDDYFANGRYTVFWNGKDNKGKWISAGKYIYVMEAGDFVDQFIMTAQEGGSGKNIDSTEAIIGGIYFFDLEQNSPEPFKIKDGTNIRFQIPSSNPIRVKITIFKD